MRFVQVSIAVEPEYEGARPPMAHALAVDERGRVWWSTRSGGMSPGNAWDPWEQLPAHPEGNGEPR
jgi:hypothetical protein